MKMTIGRWIGRALLGLLAAAATGASALAAEVDVAVAANFTAPATEIAAALARPLTTTGIDELAVVPFPN